ncbi:MAG: sugar phosphate isomerase/epimerase [Clostridia bacterium]|nr:sugar phosphate isomerase/epimerase [Clostridia bacterium]
MIQLCAFADEADKCFDGQVSALKENNISLLEMRKIDGNNAAFIHIEKAKEYKEKLDSHGISVWSLGSPICKVRQGFDRAEYAKKVEHACKVANALGAKNMRVFSFYPQFFRFNKEKVVEDLRYFNSIAESYGIRFCCENDTGLFNATAERCAWLMQQLPELGYIYDPANFRVSGQNFEDTKQFLPKADYFHLKDAVGKKVVPAGFGEGHIADIVNSLERDAVFTIEPHLTFFRGSKQYNAVFGNQFDLKSARGRFDCAVAAAKKVLTDCGYTENGTCFIKGEK